MCSFKKKILLSQHGNFVGKMAMLGYRKPVLIIRIIRMLHSKEGKKWKKKRAEQRMSGVADE